MTCFCPLQQIHFESHLSPSDIEVARFYFCSWFANTPPHIYFFFMSLEPRLLDSFLFWTFWRWSVFCLNCLIYLCYIRVYFFLINLFVLVHIHDICGGVSAGGTMHLWRSEGSSVESGLLFLLTWILGIELGLSNLSPKYSTSADLSIQPVPQSFSFSAYHIFFTF